MRRFSLKKIIFILILSFVVSSYQSLNRLSKQLADNNPPALVNTEVAQPLPKRNIRIIDGDTFELDGKKLRLFGIDAPEKHQDCYIEGKRWPCGVAAGQLLGRLLQDASPLCYAESRDKYQRVLVICQVGQLDISREMVRQGYALAYTYYSKKYLPDQEEAKANKRGIWQGSFTEPRKWRKHHHRK